MMISRLETPEFILTPLAEADYDLYHSLYSCSLVTKNMGGVLADDKVKRGFYNSLKRNKQPFNYFSWVIQCKNSKQNVGLCVLTADKEKNSTASVGVMLLSQHQAKGIAGDITLRLTHYAFNQLKQQQVIAISNVHNLAAKKLLSSLGFKFEIKTNQQQQMYSWYKKPN